MKDSKLLLYALRNTLGLCVYVAGVAWIMFNAQHLFGTQARLIGVVAVLMLFVVSALTCGLLVLGQPVWYYLKGDKTGSVKLLGLTVSLMIIATMILLAILAA